MIYANNVDIVSLIKFLDLNEQFYLFFICALNIVIELLENLYLSLWLLIFCAEIYEK